MTFIYLPTLKQAITKAITMHLHLLVRFHTLGEWALDACFQNEFLYNRTAYNC